MSSVLRLYRLNSVRPPPLSFPLLHLFKTKTLLLLPCLRQSHPYPNLSSPTLRQVWNPILSLALTTLCYLTSVVIACVDCFSSVVLSWRVSRRLLAAVSVLLMVVDELIIYFFSSPLPLFTRNHESLSPRSPHLSPSSTLCSQPPSGKGSGGGPGLCQSPVAPLSLACPPPIPVPLPGIPWPLSLC